MLCDLLTALVDSWSLWSEVTGDADLANRWREEQLRLVTSSGAYRPFPDIVHEAARSTGVSDDLADLLLRRWGEVKRYADVLATLSAVRDAGVPLGIVTNCSQPLGELAASQVGVPFDVVMTAETAGYYKPDARAYLAGCRAMGAPPEQILFVAGSPHDVPGASAVGMPVYWANRRRKPMPAGARALAVAPDLGELTSVLEIRPVA